jgi:fluoride ion exporter CrcB/FEX
MDPTVLLTLTTGFCGGVTTYSTSNHETLRYFQEGAVLIGVLNTSLILVGCLLVGLLGWAGAGLVFGR